MATVMEDVNAKTKTREFCEDVFLASGSGLDLVSLQAHGAMRSQSASDTPQKGSSLFVALFEALFS